MTFHPATLDRLRAWSALLPLLVLLAATYWLNQQVQPLPAAQDEGLRHDPDFTVTQFAATSLNSAGSPHHTLSAQRMVHYPDDDSTVLENVYLISHEPDRPSLYISAAEGAITGKGDEVFMNGEVRIVRAASEKQSERLFVTDYLHVIPDLGLARTDRPVTMTDPYNKIHAVGMELDNKARVIKLLAQVESEHVPAGK